MWRRAADEDAETRPPLTAEDASETKLDYFKLLVFASSFRNCPAPGFVSDFRGFGCSVSLVHFLFYFEGFLSCFALIGHACFQLPRLVSMITGGISNKQLWWAACFRFSSFQRVFAQSCSLPLFQLLEGLDKQAQTETRRPRRSLEEADFFHFFLVVFGEKVEKKTSNLVWTRWNKHSALIYFPLSFQTDIPCLPSALISPRRWGAHRGTSITAFLQTLCVPGLWWWTLRAAAAEALLRTRPAGLRVARMN